MVTISMSKRGEIVIPKKIRERLGLGGQVILTIRENKIEVQPGERDVIREMADDAKRFGSDVSAWKMGDDLYEEMVEEGF